MCGGRTSITCTFDRRSSRRTASIAAATRRLRRRVGRHARHRRVGDDTRDVHEEPLGVPERCGDALGQPHRAERVREEQLLDHDVVGVDQITERHDPRRHDHAVESARTDRRSTRRVRRRPCCPAGRSADRRPGSAPPEPRSRPVRSAPSRFPPQPTGRSDNGNDAPRSSRIARCQMPNVACWTASIDVSSPDSDT